jgi:hypothetical protein
MMKEAILLIFTLIMLAASVVLILGTANIVVLPAILQAYAGEEGGGKQGDNDSTNEQKAEDESAAAIADCDDNEVEEDTNFDCIARADTEVRRPTPTPTPEPEPEPETATLRVCKEITGPNPEGFESSDLTFTVTGNNPSPAQFQGDDVDGCVDVTIGPGAYTIEEDIPPHNPFFPVFLQGVTGDCTQDPNDPLGRRATGTIESAGQTEICIFMNRAGF